jgi:asparagine synthase (glutamine-hydrolysing)
VKLLARRVNGELHVSTSLWRLPLVGASPDLGGIACFLANGSMLNDRAIVDGVRTLPRAALHRLRPDGVQSDAYWQFELSAENAGRDVDELADELAERFVEAVRRRWRPEAPTHLSLSGGRDSRGVLGALGEGLGATGVRCFSYVHGEPGAETDAAVAGRLARRYGYAHELLESYSGDMAALIRVNARFGEGMTNICEEVDAWRALGGHGGGDVFVGDECMGWVDAPLRHPQDALRAVSIHDFTRLGRLRGHIEPSMERELAEGLAAEVAALSARCAQMTDLHDVKDFLYLDQRLAHVLMPWRDRFSRPLGRFERLLEPLLDRHLLDFVATLPSGLRRDKLLYRRALARRFPQLAAVPAATRAGYLANWRSEIAGQRDTLVAAVRSEDSLLDPIVSPTTLIRMIERQAGLAASVRYTARKAADFARSRPGPIGAASRKMLGARFTLDETTFLMRALVLRRVLADVSASAARP